MVQTTHLLVAAQCIVLQFCAVLGGNPFLKMKPDFVKSCQFSDPNFVACSTQAVQGMFDQLAVGVPEINILPMDPLKITQVHIVQGQGPVNIDVGLSNVTVVGFGSSKIIFNDVNRQTYEFSTKMRIPRLKIDGYYTAAGRILIVPLKGQGDCWFDCRDISIDVICDNKLVKRKGHYFYNVTATHVKFEVGNMQFRLNNLFDGSKELDAGTNEYLNQNWREVFDAIKPILTDTIENILLQILRQFFNNVPADYFVTDIK